MDTDLPADFGVVADSGLRRLDDGTVLVGGSPLRVVRLTQAGARLIDAWAEGAPVGEGLSGQRLARRLLDAGLVHPRPASSPYTPRDVSVVVPVRDRPLQVDRLVRLLDPVGEVLIVDDGSCEPLAQAAVRHPHPRGPAAARNSGWRRATRPVVAFVDSDCEPTTGWLEPLLAHLCDPRVAVVAPRIASSPGDAGVVARYEQVRSPLDLASSPGRVLARTRIGYVPAAALVVRREVLEAVGGFDEAMPYGEDVDLVWRVARTGRTVRYEPRAVVHHPPRPHVVAWLQQRFSYGTSAAPLARRHPGALAPLAVSRWSFAAWLAAGLGRPRLAATLALGTAAMLPAKLRTLRHPVREGFRLAVLGHLFAGRQVAEALLRAWWPLAVTAAIPSRRVRRGVVVAATVPYLVEWVLRRPRVDPLRWNALRLLDDFAYGAGVWWGCLREHTVGPLRPDLSDWPGRAPAVEPPG